MKILINTPQLLGKGGVGTYYLSLKNHWQENVRYHTSGSRKFLNGNLKIPGIFFLPSDIIKFVSILIFWKPDIIILNPSFIRNSLKRELVFLNLAFLFRKKVCVFFRGWHKEYETKVNTKSLCTQLNKTRIILVLANEFKRKLIKWGVYRPIELTTTKVDDSLLSNFDINKKKFDNKKILFLATIKKEKGIFEALKVMTFFNLSSYYVELNVAGIGPQLENAKKYVRLKKIKNVHFLGHVSGKKLSQAFIENDIFFFPSHGEGMPNSVLEAMSFGLPIITRPVGGIKDFFEDGKMGFVTKSKEPKDFFLLLEKLMVNPHLVKKMGFYNHNYAKEHFMASKVAFNLETLLKDI